jgi:hypothetical protein
MNKFIQWIVNISFISLAWPLFLMGWLQKVYLNDVTYITWGLTTVVLYAIVLTLWDKWEQARWISDALVFGGLIGTVIGFIIAFEIDSDRVSDLSYVQEMIGVVLNGLGTALGTTLVGAAGSLWLRFNEFFFHVQKH